jgi:hypothetical protein
MSSDAFGNWDPGPLAPDETLFVGDGGPGELALTHGLNEDTYIISFREAAEV